MDQAQKDFFYNKNFTLKGRMFYPKITTPEPNDRGQLKYGMMFAWSIQGQEAITQQINAFLVEAKQKFAPNIPDLHFNIPIKKWGVYQRQDGKPSPAFLENCYWLNASSGEQFKPTVVDQNRQEVINPAEIYSGRNVLFNFSFYMYSANGKNGISTNIGAVMLMEGGDREAGQGGVNLDQAFGSFQADMGGAQAATPQALPQNSVGQVAAAPVQSAPVQGGFDPVTGQPLAAAQPKGFDPLTGQPIY